MIVPYIRSSSYNNWDFCQLQYFQTYVLGHYMPSGKKAQLGTMVHKVMEVMANCKKLLQEGRKRTFVDDGIGKVKFTQEELYTEKFMLELLQRSYEYYQKDCIHSYTNTDYNFCKKQCSNIVDKYPTFDPRNREIIATEPHFDIPIEEDWAHYEVDGVKGQLAIKGTIDTVTALPDRPTKSLEVVDWKTGERKDWATGKVKDYFSLMKDPQLLLYNHALSKLYPEYEDRIMTIFYTRSGGPFSLAFDEDDDKMFLEMLRKRFEEIMKADNPKPISKNRTDFKCTRLCAFHKNQWPGTGKSMCRHTEDTIKVYGIEETIKRLKKPGFDPGFYSAPG